MCYIETEAICSHPLFGQFIGSHQTWGEVFCRFYLAVFNAVLITITVPDATRVYIRG
jgi:hypothetical protein